MATPAEITNIIRLYIVANDAAPNTLELGLLEAALDNGATTAELAESIVAGGAFTGTYGTLSNADFSEAYLTTLLGTAVSESDLADGIALLTSVMNGGVSQAEVVVIAENFLASPSTLTDPTFGPAATELAERTAAAADAQGLNDGATFYLTDGQDLGVNAGDTYLGTAGDDTYIARGNGSLDNADIIDGGAGTDTVEVLLDNAETAESPLLMNVEILKVQAQQDLGDLIGADGGEGGYFDGYPDNDNDDYYWSFEEYLLAMMSNNDSNIHVDGDNDVEFANIDAGDMGSEASGAGIHGTGGVSQYWSEDSRGDVIIEDVSRDSHITTVGMRETDPGSVDLEVYFDPQNITAKGQQAAGSSLTISMANVYNIATDANPVEGFDEISFSVDGDLVEVNIDGLESYAAVASAIEDALAAAGITGVNVAAQPAQNAFFSINIETFSAGDLAGTYTPILLTSDSSDLTTGSFDLAESETSGNIVQTQSNVVAEPLPALTSVEVILDRVGKNSDGGDLVIGSDSHGDSDSPGIQQFNIDVDRDSSLFSVKSTNGGLEVINVENISDNNASGDGDLTIGYIRDVRVFDASTMSGDVQLGAELSWQVTEKYLELTDDDPDPSADNSQTQHYTDVVDNEFSYDFGSGDDTLVLDISRENWEDEGTTTREDFILEINGGAGDDNLITFIDEGTDDDEHWYLNSKQNANLTVNGDAGDDTIRTMGAGDFHIDGGADSDTIYTDNEAGRARYYFNAENTDFYDLDSQDAASVSAVNANLTVTFKGFESAEIEIADSYGKTSNVTISDLTVNQAIKDAINNDDVLNKLIVAKDGPGNTLLIRSLIDGDNGADQLTITFGSETLNAAQTLAAVTSFTAPALMATAAYANLVDGYVTSSDYDGSDSDSVSDNTVQAGIVDGADDVIVLGTDGDSNDTVVYGPGLTAGGTEFVVNFDSEQDSTAILANTATVITDVQGAEVVPGSAAVPAVAESFELKVSGATADGDLLMSANLGNVTVPVELGDSAAVVAAAIVAGGTGVGSDEYGDYTAAIDPTDASIVIFTETTTGGADITPDVAVSDIGVAGTGVVVTVENGVDGAAAVGVGADTPAVAEVFTVTFGAATVDGNVAFDGDSVPVLSGDSAIDVGASVAAGTYTNWTAVDNANGTVTFTAVVAGAVADVTAGDFVGANVITGYTLTPSDGLDMVDFSAYGADAVYVDGALVTGALAANDLYVHLIESATNAGQYTINLMDSGADGAIGAADASVGVIGVIDFGASQAFLDANFIV